MKWLLLLFVIILGTLPLCLAQTIESNSYDLQIIYNKVLVENEMLFDKSQDLNFTIDLPSDVSALSLYIDDQIQEPVVEHNKLILVYSSAQKIKLSYITKEPLEKGTFLINLVTPFNTNSLKITLTLPEGAILEKQLRNGISGSIYPKPDKATTDGKSLIFEWEGKDVNKDQESAIFIKYKIESKIKFLIWILSLIIILLLGFLLLNKPKIKTIIKKEKAIEIHLKEDEEQIVNILKRKEGSCEQGTLRVITGFSKATLSRLLKELEDRKIVYKEKRGKKNLVFLRKH